MQAHLARRRDVPAEIKELLDSIRGASMRSPDDHDEFGALVSTPECGRVPYDVLRASAMQTRPGGMLVLAFMFRRLRELLCARGWSVHA